MLHHELLSPLLACGCALSFAAAARQTRAKRKLSHRNKALAAAGQVSVTASANFVSETRHLAEDRLPALVEAITRHHPDVTVPGLRVEAHAGTDIETWHQAVLDTVRDTVGAAVGDAAETARAAMRGVFGEAQSHLEAAQLLVSEAISKAPAADLGPLMGMDHVLSLARHTIQRGAILAGAWPGIQRDTCSVADLIESARGRIRDFNRVVFTQDSLTGPAWVEGPYAEAAAVVLAELLANATQFSQHEVTVQVCPVENGVCIVVDDRGVSMNARQREAAQVLLNPRAPMNTGVPAGERVGFAVIGLLSQRYGLQADVSQPSAFGGVRAVLFLHRRLLGQPPQPDPHRARPAPIGRPPQPGPVDQEAIPQRTRRPAAHAARPAPPVAVPGRPEDFPDGWEHLTGSLRAAEARTAGEEAHGDV